MGMHKGMTGKIGPGSADLTLADYIKRKQDSVNDPKLTFEEWWATVMPEDDYDMSRWKGEFEQCWKAAQGIK